MAFRTLAAVCGFIFVVLIVISAVLLGDQPFADDSVSDIRAYLARDQSAHRWSVVFGSVGVVFAVIFFAGLITSLARCDRVHGEGWSIVATIGAVLLAALAGVGDTLSAIMFYRGGADLDAPTLRLLQDGMTLGYALMGPGIALLTLAVAVPSFQHGVFPSWHGVLGLLVAVAGLASPFAVLSTASGSEWLTASALPALLIWSVVSSILLFRTEAARTESAQPLQQWPVA